MDTRRLAALALALGVLVAPSASGAELPESKRALIRELLAISGFAGLSEQMSEQQSVVELMRIKPNYQPMMEFAVSEQQDLSDEQKRLLGERLDDFDLFAQRFSSLFVERLDFAGIIEAVYLPLYDQYFSEGDLEKMLEFYRTPVGRKAIEVMPALLQEAGLGVDRVVRPQAVSLIQEIVAEERAKLQP
jgi:hypothetical protein